ncbi:AAA family ATPase [Clostridium gasigenes]|uniref:AAA family ATPase n=1 Tax=Clostridium gasigenes TaxID=94869 RepID=UPI001113AAB7|nr:AAA family ATPase [Clostridium gasigenes]
MTEKEIKEELMSLYKRVSRVNKASKFYKCDLHIHTPASLDYQRCFNKDEEEQEYHLFLEHFIESDVDVIAITDHNTVNGYYRIQEIVEKDNDLKMKLGNKLILPGVEITCYGKHFLAIFPKEYKKSKLDALLIEAGIDMDEQGTENVSADRLSPLTLCEKVEDYGGIVIIAHADSDNGLLQEYFKKRNGDVTVRGKSIEKTLKSQAVHGICYNSEKNLDRLIDLRKNFNVENISFLRASDSHSVSEEYMASGVPLGSRCSWISMGKLSYNALKLALKDEGSRVINELPPKKTYPNILGLCVKDGFIKDINGNEWAVVPFSNALNCIIGARGTGKSTMIDILKFLLNPQNEDLGDSIIGRFDKAIVFINIDDNVYVIRMNAPISMNRLNITYYYLKGNNFIKISKTSKFKTNKGAVVLISDYLNASEIQGFRQKDILEISKLELGPTMMVRSLLNLEHRERMAQLRKEEEIIKSSIKQQCKEISKYKSVDKNADLTSEYLKQQYSRYIGIQKEINGYLEGIVKRLNKELKDELQIVSKTYIKESVYEEMIDRWLRIHRDRTYASYDIIVKYKKLLKIVFNNNDNDNYELMYNLFAYESEKIAERYSISCSDAGRLCDFCNGKINDAELLIVPQMIIDYELNVNHGISNKKVFVRRNRLSFGQKAVGMLLLILVGATKLGEMRPLVIDQPEDDLDNSYIYHTLVKQFSLIKHCRQLIIATHNPNIPIAGDSENILVMKSDGINGWVDLSGNIDNEKVAERVLQILEGDIEAFEKRAEKFGYKLVKINN